MQNIQNMDFRKYCTFYCIFFNTYFGTLSSYFTYTYIFCLQRGQQLACWRLPQTAFGSQPPDWLPRRPSAAPADGGRSSGGLLLLLQPPLAASSYRCQGGGPQPQRGRRIRRRRSRRQRRLGVCRDIVKVLGSVLSFLYFAAKAILMQQRKHAAKACYSLQRQQVKLVARKRGNIASTALRSSGALQHTNENVYAKIWT